MGQKAGLVYEMMGITEGVSLHGTRAGDQARPLSAFTRLRRMENGCHLYWCANALIMDSPSD